MSIVKFNGLPYWSLDPSKTGERTTYLWVGVVESTMCGKNKVTSSLCVVFKGRGCFVAPQHQLPISEKNLSNQGNWYWLPLALLLWILKHFLSKYSSQNDWFICMFPSWVEWMLDRIIFSWPPKSGKVSREIQKFRSMPPFSVSLVERTFKYIFSKNLPSKSFENTSWCWSGSTRWNTKCVFKICHASTLYLVRVYKSTLFVLFCFYEGST